MSEHASIAVALGEVVAALEPLEPVARLRVIRAVAILLDVPLEPPKPPVQTFREIQERMR